MLPELIHAHTNRHLEDLSFWLTLAAQLGDPVLELGCGTGRVLIPLAQTGHNAIGLDYDLAMLKCLKANIESRMKHKPMLIDADISKLNLAMQFPLIILPCNTFSTLLEEKRLACLGCVVKHLKPGGIFAFCIPNPEVMLGLPAQAETEVEDEFNHPQTGNPVQVSSAWRRRKHTFAVTWIYDHLLPDGRVERFAAEITHQIVAADTYLEEIRSVGLRATQTFGDFDRSPYQDDSPYLICLATH